jgi:uncharacterized protein (DUF111 family)
MLHTYLQKKIQTEDQATQFSTKLKEYEHSFDKVRQSFEEIKMITEANGRSLDEKAVKKIAYKPQ